MALSARVPSGAVTAGFVKEVWSKRFLDAVESSLVVAKLVDRSWEDDLVRERGDKVNVGITNNVTATEVVVGTAGAALNPLTGTKLQIVLNEWWEANIDIDAMTWRQGHINLQTVAEKRGAYAVSKKLDSTLCGRFSALNGGAALGTDGVAWNQDTIDEAVETLDKNDVPRENRAWIINPSGKRDLRSIERFSNKNYDPAKMSFGLVGDIDGTPVFMTNNLTAATTGAYACLLHEEAIALVINPSVEVVVMDGDFFKDKHLVRVRAEALWGSLEMRDTYGVSVLTRSK